MPYLWAAYRKRYFTPTHTLRVLTGIAARMNWGKRLPIIRHLRWLYLEWELRQYWKQTKNFWPTLDPNDLEFLNRVWRGEE